MEHSFVLVWCSEGLEYIEDITLAEQKSMWNVLKGNEPKGLSNTLRSAILRARYNTHRSYEIYSVSAQEGISAKDIKGMFDADPQTAADTIRRLGYQIYSDRDTRKRAIV